MIAHSKGAVDILEMIVRHPDLATRIDAVVGINGAFGGSPLADTDTSPVRPSNRSILPATLRLVPVFASSFACAFGGPA